MTKPIPPLDLSWLLIESPVSTTHVGAMLLFKKPGGRAPVVREIVEAYRGVPAGTAVQLRSGAPERRRAPLPGGG